MNISKAICPNCGKRMSITKANCKTCGINLEGEFKLPQLAELSREEQNFIVAFVKVHGSIKKMEEILNISYPTVKNKLNTLADKLELDLNVSQSDELDDVKSNIKDGFKNFGERIEQRIKMKFENLGSNNDKSEKNNEALDALSKGEISVEEAIQRMRKGREEES